MRHLLWATVVAIVLGSLQHQKANLSDGPSDEQVLIDLDSRVLRAVRTADRLTLGDLIAPEFVCEDWTGSERRTHDLLIHDVVQDWKTTNLDQANLTSQIYDRVGIATSVVHFTGAIGGKAIDTRLYLVDVWIKGGNDWRLVRSKVAPLLVDMGAR